MPNDTLALITPNSEYTKISRYMCSNSLKHCSGYFCVFHTGSILTQFMTLLQYLFLTVIKDQHLIFFQLFFKYHMYFGIYWDKVYMYTTALIFVCFQKLSDILSLIYAVVLSLHLVWPERMPLQGGEICWGPLRLKKPKQRHRRGEFMSHYSEHVVYANTVHQVFFHESDP